MNVLIADDEPTTRIMLEGWVSAWGYQYHSAGDGAEAWDWLSHNQRSCLAIVDWVMPKMDGIELSKKIKQELGYYVYIILLTAKSNKQDIITGLDSGADDFLSKPVQTEEMRSRLAAGARILHYQEALADRNEQLRILFNGMPGAVVFKDSEGRWLQANQNTLRLFRLEDIPYQGRTDLELAQEPRGLGNLLLDAALADQSAWEQGKLLRQEMEVLCPDSSKKCFETMRTPLFYPDGSRKGMVFIAQDITERKELEEKLRQEAHYDPLTGLMNRRYFEELLKKAMISAARFEHPLSLCMCDMDNFKLINDKYSHMTGDEVLVEFAKIAREEIRANDMAGRFGGDEFYIAFPGSSSRPAMKCLARIRERFIKTQFSRDDLRFSPSASFGIAELQPEMKTPEQFMLLADQALKQAKIFGKNKIGISSQTQDIFRSSNRSGDVIILEGESLRQNFWVEHQASSLLDPLTGMLNRHVLLERLDEIFKQAADSGQCFSLCLIEVDTGKVVDDKDILRQEQLLAAAGHIAREEIRVSDIAGRTGIREFCLVLPHTTAEASIICLRRIHQQMQAYCMAGSDSPAPIPARFGITEMQPHLACAEDLLRQAEYALRYSHLSPAQPYCLYSQITDAMPDPGQE